jgi:hypothetical protein
VDGRSINSNLKSRTLERPVMMAGATACACDATRHAQFGDRKLVLCQSRPNKKRKKQNRVQLRISTTIKVSATVCASVGARVRSPPLPD